MGHNVTATSARITVVEGARVVTVVEVLEEGVDSEGADADAEESKGLLSSMKVTNARAKAAISATSFVRDIANQSGSRPALFIANI